MQINDSCSALYSFSSRKTTQTVNGESASTNRVALSFAALMAAQAKTESQATQSVSSTTAVATAGVTLREIDMGNLLTEEDKRLTGWPSAQPNWIAVNIALDRQDGFLRGPVTLDYLLGNPERNIVGLAERFPEANDFPPRLTEILRRLMG